MQVGAGTADEVLIVVPIGEIDAHCTITVGLDNSHPNTAGVDSDPLVGISDGTDENLFEIVDKDDYSSTSPCLPSDNTPIHDNTQVTSTTDVLSTFKLSFTPFNNWDFVRQLKREATSIL